MIRAVLGIVLFCVCTSNALACLRPSAPEIPNPNSAVTAQMVKAQKEVKAYIADAEKYLKCVRRDSEHDRMVTEMESVASNFNESIRAYKEKMKNA